MSAGGKGHTLARQLKSTDKVADAQGCGDSLSGGTGAVTHRGRLHLIVDARSFDSLCRHAQRRLHQASGEHRLQHSVVGGRSGIGCSHLHSGMTLGRTGQPERHVLVDEDPAFDQGRQPGAQVVHHRDSLILIVDARMGPAHSSSKNTVSACRIATALFLDLCQLDIPRRRLWKQRLTVRSAAYGLGLGTLQLVTLGLTPA